MPNESVAAEQLAILRGEVGNDVAFGVGECATRRLDGIPFHRISRCNLAKVGGVAEAGEVRGIRQLSYSRYKSSQSSSF